MTAADDFPGEMDMFPFDGTDADALFAATPGSEIPDAFRDVAELVRAARQPGSEDELGTQDVIVAQVAAAIGEHLASPSGDAHERTPALRKFRTAKVAAAATAALMLGATAAAAATGSLPAPVQSSVASGLSGVGIDIPAHHHVELAAKHAAAPAHARGHHHRAPAPGAAGLVASVNGITTTGTCGTPATAGVFTLTGHKGATFTVNVATSTTFLDKAVTGPTFGNVCVGDAVFAKGTVSGTTVTAASVQIAPMRHKDEHHHQGAFGLVASVNGSTTAGMCGAASATGAFTLTGFKGATFTVNVTGSTKFFEVGLAGATFVNVCVGAKVGAAGDVAGTTVAATNVFVLPAHSGGFRGFHPKRGRGHFPKDFALGGKAPTGSAHAGTDPKGADPKGAGHNGSGSQGTGSHRKHGTGSKHGH